MAAIGGEDVCLFKKSEFGGGQHLMVSASDGSSLKFFEMVRKGEGRVSLREIE